MYENIILKDEAAKEVLVFHQGLIKSFSICGYSGRSQCVICMYIHPREQWLETQWLMGNNQRHWLIKYKAVVKWEWPLACWLFSIQFQFILLTASSL